MLYLHTGIYLQQEYNLRMKNENDKQDWYEYLGSLVTVIILFGG